MTLASLNLETRGYRLPRDPLVEEVLNPCFANAHRVRGLFGYFTSSVLGQVAAGLTQFLGRTDTVQPLRFIISPSLSEDDARTIETTAQNPQGALEDELAARLLQAPDAEGKDAVEKHTLRCFAWLLARGLLDLQIAYVKGGIFHDKVWEFSDPDYGEGIGPGHAVFVAGSANATRQALRANRERMGVYPTYVEGIEGHLTTYRSSFEDAFAGRDLDGLWPVTEALQNQWIERWKTEYEPTDDDLRVAARRVGDLWLVPDGLRSIDVPTSATERQEPFIPEWLDWHAPPYEHQSEAVVAWESNARSGILEMATGAGKTNTALIAAARAYHEGGRPMLLVVAVPFTPLLRQWQADCGDFGIAARTPTIDTHGRTQKFADLGAMLQDLHLGIRRFGCVVSTHHLIGDPEFRAVMQDARDLGVTTMLVGDEVHRLGALRFISDPPDVFDYRLGLSATPTRQYDLEGTQALEEFFGGIVYEFGLGRAIGNCLVEYDYYVVPVELTTEEMEIFLDLSEAIGRLYRPDVSFQENRAFAAAVFKRRAFVDTASGKLPALREALTRHSSRPIRHTLIYSTSRDTQQLEDVQALLEELDVENERITYKETPDPDNVDRIIQEFRAGRVGVLNAMKVLDEGFNIPEIRTAYLLSSTGTEREWTQRRGRVLRQSPSSGKAKATIVDFLVIPPAEAPHTPSVNNYVEGEIGRVEAFAAHAANKFEDGGGYDVITKVLQRYLGKGRNE